MIIRTSFITITAKPFWIALFILNKKVFQMEWFKRYPDFKRVNSKPLPPGQFELFTRRMHENGYWDSFGNETEKWKDLLKKRHKYENK